MILETMRAATNTVEIANMAHVMIMSPPPMSWSFGSVVGRGLSARLTPSNMPSMVVVVIWSCLPCNVRTDTRMTRKDHGKERRTCARRWALVVPGPKEPVHAAGKERRGEQVISA